MMLHRYLESRYIAGNSSVNRLSPALDLSFMLAKLKNFSTDEYSTMDSDGMSVPPLACAFARMSQYHHIVAVVDEDGYLVLYNTHKTGEAAVVKSWQVHANAVFDLEWLSEENKILTGSGDQTIALYDAETCQKISTFKGHASSIKSISSKVGNDAIFVSGSRDGHIMVWDRRIHHRDETISPVDTIFNAHMLQQQKVNTGKNRKKHNSYFVKDAQQSVTAVLFQSENYLISAGAVDGCLKVWDIRKTYKRRASGAQPVHVFQYPGANTRKHGYSSLVQDSQGRRLFANCTDDVIYEYDMAAYNPKPIRSWRGHKNSTFYVKSTLSSDDQYLLSGSSDEMAYIWQINNPGATPVVLRGHTAEVTTVAWCPNDVTKVVTLSDDTKTKFWRIYCRELKKQFLPRWLGQAKTISKRPETSRDIDTQTPSTSSPSPLNKSTSSPQLCIRTWLKRKSQLTEIDGSQEASPNKSLCRNGCTDSSDSASQKDKAGAAEYRKTLSEKACRRPHLSASSDDAVTNTEDFTTRSETISSCSTSSPECFPKKRSHDESEDMSSDSPVFQVPPCAKCLKEEQAESTSVENITAKRRKTEQQADISFKDSNDTKHELLAEDNKKYNENFQTLPSKMKLQSPLKASQVSPSKLKTSLRQDENSENLLSPRKLMKRQSDSDDSSVTSPKRPCLTNLESNRLERSICSVKTSLFTDTPQEYSYASSNHVKQNNVELIALCSRTDEMNVMLESDVNFECMTKKCSASSPLSLSQTVNEFHSHTKSPTTEILKCIDISVTKDALNCKGLQDGDFNSPTRNLPNLVMDEAREYVAIPTKSNAQNQKHNWLTQIRLEKLKNSKTVPKQTNQGKLSPKVTKGMRKINSYFK